MSTSPQVQFAVQQGCQPQSQAKAEARALFTVMRRTGKTLEDIRDLTGVPPETRSFFQSYVLEYPEERYAIERIVAFRRQVGIEFERLLESAGSAQEAGGSAPETDARRNRLTPREREILQLISEIKSTKNLGGLLGIARKTAEIHRSNIMRKLNIHRSTDLIAYAAEHSLNLPTSGDHGSGERGTPKRVKSAAHHLVRYAVGHGLTEV